MIVWGFERPCYRLMTEFGVSGILLAKSEDLMVYKDTNHFDGYFVRDESYFDTLKTISEQVM